MAMNMTASTATTDTRSPAAALPTLHDERYVEWQTAYRALEEEVLRIARLTRSRRGMLAITAAALVIARLRAEQSRLTELIAAYEARKLAGSGSDKRRAA